MNNDNNTKKKVKTNKNNIKTASFTIPNVFNLGSERKLDISKMSDDIKLFHFNRCVFNATMILPKMSGFTMSHLFQVCSVFYSQLFNKPYHYMEDWIAITTPFNLDLLMAIPKVYNKSCSSKIIELMNEYYDKNVSTIKVRIDQLIQSPNFESDYIKCFS